MPSSTERRAFETEHAGRPPAVLQVVPALVTGGVERGTVEIATALVKAGWRAVVASSGGPMVHEIERAGAEHITLPLASKNPVVIYRNIARLAGLIRDESIDLVHARSRAPAAKQIRLCLSGRTIGAAAWKPAALRHPPFCCMTTMHAPS